MGLALTKLESKTLDSLEETIEKGLAVFYEVGAALKQIRDERLYQEVFGTFEDYCRERWGMTRAFANYHIAASGVKDNLATIVAILPANESQARPLTKLEPEQQVEAWQQVLDSAPETEDGHKLITAKVVSEVVASMLPETANGNDRPFDRDEEGCKLRDVLRSRLDKWPEDMRSEAAHWIRQVLREYQLGHTDDEMLKARIEELEKRNEELENKMKLKRIHETEDVELLFYIDHLICAFDAWEQTYSKSFRAKKVSDETKRGLRNSCDVLDRKNAEFTSFARKVAGPEEVEVESGQLLAATN